MATFFHRYLERYNLKETHQYLLTVYHFRTHISGTRVAATSQCEKLKCVGYLQWYRVSSVKIGQLILELKVRTWDMISQAYPFSLR